MNISGFPVITPWSLSKLVLSVSELFPVTTAPEPTTTDWADPLAFTMVGPLNACPPVKSTVLPTAPEFVAVSVIEPETAFIVPPPVTLRLKPAGLVAWILPVIAVMLPALPRVKSVAAAPLRTIDAPKTMVPAAVVNVAALRITEPDAVILLLVLIDPAKSVRVKPPVPAVEIPLPVIAAESVKVTLPAPAND